MIKIFKSFIYPIRYLFTKLLLKELITETHINIAANYIYTQGIEGDYLEFGCFKGESFINAYKNIKIAEKDWTSIKRASKAYSKKKNLNEYSKKNYNRRFFAFDSFEGLPEAKGIDQNHNLFKKGRYDCSKESFINNLQKSNIDLNEVIIIKGFYEKSLINNVKVNYDLKKAAIIMIDCDYYESTKYVLNFITNLIQTGSIIIFDDWFNYKGDPLKGEQLACKEWLNKNNNINLIPYKEYGLTQKIFIVKLDITNSN